MLANTHTGRNAGRTGIQGVSGTKPPLLEAVAISKSFGSICALDSVDLTVSPGTFHAVIGENGAGKSTLARCILGFHPADSGDVRIDGVRATTLAETRKRGVGMVFQHFTLVPSMTAAENLALARPDLPAIIEWSEEQERLDKFLKHAPFPIDLGSQVGHLSAGQKQKVEILKQLYLGTKVLILDEPTSVLTPAESSEVMTVLSGMVRSGLLSVILITHKLREVITFADEVTVLRRGRLAAVMPVSRTSATGLAEFMMGGTRPPDAVDKGNPPSTVSALELRDLSVRGDNGLAAVKQVSLTLNAGEILGIAGVSGNGQRELVQAIGGQRSIDSGEILAFGKVFQHTRGGIREAGLLTVPEEPLQNATVPSMSVAENIVLRQFDQYPFTRGRWFLDPKAIRDLASEAIARFSIRPPSPGLPVKSLSGGNVQRTVLARDLGSGTARIMVAANPCLGLDIAATAFVRNHLIELRNAGGAVLLVSEDLDELITLCDRILVISEGTIVHETLRSEMDLTMIGRFMGGSSLPSR